MEIKWRRRQTWFARRLTGSRLVFALTAGLVAVTPGLNGAAKAVNLEEDCSLRVAPVDPGNNNQEMVADLAGAAITVDLYKVADAQPVSGYDTYTYKFLDEYKDLESIYKGDPNNAEWKKMAQEAASYVKKSQEAEAPEGTAQPVMSGAISNGYAELGGLKCGLYLLIARGTDIEDYWTTVNQQGDVEEEDAEAAESIATIARSNKYVYTYSPEMISLPGKEGNTTAGNGEWLYNMTASLKPEQSVRYGSLEIVKTLLSYETKDPATFVFRVTGVLGEETVFDDMVSLTFTPEDIAGQKSVILEDRIPVGTVVTVTEEYSGGVYGQISVTPDPVTIEANNIVSVPFTNDYNETDRGGGSVTNSFNQSETGWRLQQIYDDGRVEEQGNE